MAYLERWSPQVLAILRIVTASLFVEHATMKFFAFPAAMGSGQSLPTLMVVAGLIELVAGVLIILGLFARYAAFVASGEMAAAYFMAHAPQSFWPALNMGEAAILFCFIFLYIAFAGAGAWSCDAAIARRRS